MSRRVVTCGLAAFTSATGSAGTIGAGDRLKDDYGAKHRRRRGARVPDDARERVRRAQHPGHRRQAHPADPQRDEHRRDLRGQRCRHRPARRAVQHRGRPARTSPRQRASTRVADRGAAALRLLGDLQHARGDQDRQAARPRRRRRDRHDRHRRRRDVPRAREQDYLARHYADGFSHTDAAEVFGQNTWATSGPRT